MWRLLCIAVLHTTVKRIKPSIWSGGPSSTGQRCSFVTEGSSIAQQRNPWKYQLFSDIERTECYDVIGRDHVTWLIKPRSTSTPSTWSLPLPYGSRPRSSEHSPKLHPICFWWPSFYLVAFLSRLRLRFLTASCGRWWTTTIYVFQNSKRLNPTTPVVKRVWLFESAMPRPRSAPCQRIITETQTKYVRHLAACRCLRFTDFGVVLFCDLPVLTCLLSGVPKVFCY